ncbi:protein of unknown function DUF374 [Thermocrinis albus DSM 14484]|uniref:DUF374 domain-containing protein n=1 Tax=Thermocrinis albus (strain DSM 14484 / JCM 11386 / HI 11/12) TaxID=638303 RepID=D3SNG1_THEAH|nr:lysophospholipid acyltransferase family protein [Thermocrinis albus]ADC88698.1 protein of unknown function DUF374 [Thermocrinis albus DSM 14484]
MKRKLLLLALLLTPVFSLLLRLLSRTIRWEKRYDFDRDRGKIYAIWHGNALGIALLGIDRGIVTLASRFRDGELAARLLEKLGYIVVRGSSEEGKVEKGGRVALLKLMEYIKEGRNIAITVDGPKGPAFRVKEGVVFLAQKTSAPIVPAYAWFEKKLELPTWDRMVIPLPFTKAKLLVAEEIQVAPEDDLEVRRAELEEVLLSLLKRRAASLSMEPV